MRFPAGRLLAIGGITAVVIVGVATLGPSLVGSDDTPVSVLEHAVAHVEERTGVRAVAIDALVGCAGTVGDRLAVLSLDSGPRFFEAFPGAAASQELAGAATPVTVVVYRGVYPGGVLVRPGSEPRTVTQPGTVDVCVATNSGAPALSGASYAVYGDIPLEGSVVTIR